MYIYIFIHIYIYIYIYILKLVTFVDTFDSNVSWIYKHKEKFTTHSPILVG